MGEDDKTEKTEDTKTKVEHKRAEDETTEEVKETEASPKLSPKHKAHHWLQWCAGHKKVTILSAAALVLFVIFVIPFTRYSVLGLFLKQNFSVVVLDSQSGKPVSSALVALGGRRANTDGEGKATLRVPVGEHGLSITKAYYKSFSQEVVVPVNKPDSTLKVKLQATGRPVPVVIVNTIDDTPLVGAVLTAGQSKATTDDKGQATLVVPAGQDELAASITANGFNKKEVTVTVTIQENKANTFALAPAGKIYFLSNQSGKIDVIKSDLDGKNRETIVAGTGKEKKGQTVLLAARDWRYLALLSRRDNTDAKLYLIDTKTDKMSIMDEGTANFELSGWEGHHFVYRVERYKLDYWQPKRWALKSYNADTQKLTTLDQTGARGNQYDSSYEYFTGVHIIEGKVVYAKDWSGYSASRKASLTTIKTDGAARQLLKTADAYISTRPYEPSSLYVQIGEDIFEFENNALKSLPDLDVDDFYNTDYNTYLLSPDGKRTFWSENRDGKLAFLIGDTDGKNGKRVATLSTGFQAYGWFTDKYLLVSKEGSELFIMPVSGVDNEAWLSKITDYYRAHYRYAGYGGGYGGF